MNSTATDPSNKPALQKNNFPIFLPTLVGSFAISVGCMFAIYQLNHIADRSNQSRLLLTQAKEQMSRLNSLEWEGVVKGDIDANLEEELEENAEETNIILTELKQLSRQHELDNFFALHQNYNNAIATVLEQLENGNSGFDYDAFEIDEIYDEVYAEISSLEDIYIGRRMQARQLVDIGTAISLILCAFAISFLSCRFSHKIQNKNNELNSAFDSLKSAQAQLIQQEKMAALGQLVAGVAHEVNNPLGIIKASATNSLNALHDILAGLPKWKHDLKPSEEACFFNLIEQALKSETSVAIGGRQLKRKISAKLKEAGVENHRRTANLLKDMGVSEDIDSLLPLLQSARGEWLVQYAYNLTRPFLNNRAIVQAAERSSKIVFSLKYYAHRNADGEKQIVRLEEGLETVLLIYHNQLKHDFQIIRNYSGIPDFLGYPDELLQVWTNLIYNAVQAMNHSGTLTLETRNQSEGVEVSIIDTGPGIPDEVQARMFEAFFTTKPAGEGSGLGLHISKQIIDKHNGTITVDSRPGQTIFTVFLPTAGLSLESTTHSESKDFVHV